MIEILESNKVFGDNEKAAQALSEFKILANYVKQSGAYDNIEFDLSLARGLDYYTGLIFEVTVTGFEVGSLGGGKFPFPRLTSQVEDTITCWECSQARIFHPWASLSE